MMISDRSLRFLIDLPSLGPARPLGSSAMTTARRRAKNEVSVKMQPLLVCPVVPRYGDLVAELGT